jgi:broad specificity phosphatase PhoE
VTTLDAQRLKHVEAPFVGGESRRQVVDRVRSLLDDVGGDSDCSSVVVIGHTATRWALDHLINDVPLKALVEAPFDWRPGWTYTFG